MIVLFIIVGGIKFPVCRTEHKNRIPKIRPLTGRTMRKVDGLFLSPKSKIGGQSQWQNWKPLNISESKRNEQRRSLHRNSTGWSVWRTERSIWGQACDRERRHSMGLLSPRLTAGTRQAWQRRQGFYRYLNVAALPCSLIPTPPDDEQSPGIFHLQEDFAWTIPQLTTPLARLSESRSARPPISSVCISARPQKRQWRTKSSVCSVKKSAECDFFLNLMKKSLTFCLWKDSKVYSD